MISNSFLRLPHLTDKFHIQINFDSGLLFRRKYFGFRLFSGRNSITISMDIAKYRADAAATANITHITAQWWLANAKNVEHKIFIFGILFSCFETKRENQMEKCWWA